MKYLLPIIALLLLPACSDPISSIGGPTSATPSAPAIPAIRSLSPLDLNARGLPESPPHPETRRLLVQAPEGTDLRLTRNGRNLPFSVRRVLLDDGTLLHELTLDQPLGAETAILDVGDYLLALEPDEIRGQAPAPEIRPFMDGALADDFANPRGALFPSTDQVALIMRGDLPSLAAGVSLRCGEGQPVPLLLSIHRDGIMATPAETLRPDRIYHVEFADGNPLFRLRCLGSPGRRAIRLLQSDIRRSGAAELLCLFADGEITTLRDPDPEYARQVVIFPRGGGLALDFVTGDFNGNGAADLALLTRENGRSRLTVLSNETRLDDVRFSVHTEYLDMQAPIALASADFDRDGRDDIAILDAFGDILVRSGQSSRRIQGLPHRGLAAQFAPGDFSGNGKPDLFVLGADGRGHTLTNLENLEEARTRALDAANTQRFTVGELDGDRRRDLVLTGFSREICVALASQREIVRFHPYAGERSRLAGSVMCADVNGNARGDILVGLEDEYGVCEEVALYLNSDDSDGMPDAILPLGVRVHVNDIEFWRNHLLIASDAGLLILRVNSQTLPPVVDSNVRFLDAYNPVPQLPSPLASTVADFNDDGRADLATIDRDGKLQIWLAGEDGDAFAPVGEPIELGGVGRLIAIDFDRDNYPDLLFIPDDHRLRPKLLRNNRGRDFSDASEFLPTPPSNLRGAPAVGDFDRDGALDVLWPSPFGRVQYNLGGGEWRESRAQLEVRDERGIRLEFSGELCCADFTGNGIPDVVAVMQPGPNIGPQYLVLWVGTGLRDDEGPPFIPYLSAALPGAFFGLSPADFTGDGRLDLAAGYAPEGRPPRLTLLRLNAQGLFEVFEGSPAPKGTLLAIAMDDLERNGNLDLIVSERVGNQVQVTLWIYDGHGRFFESEAASESLAEALAGFQAVNLSLADFTGNGRPDLLAIDESGNVVVVRTFLP